MFTKWLSKKYLIPLARNPMNMSGIFPEHVSAESSSNINPNPSEVISKVRNPRTTFEIFKIKIFKKTKNAPQGARGGLRIFWGVNISFFCENKPPVKFQNSNWPPSKIFQKNLKKTKNCPPGGQGVGVRI